MHEDHTCQNTAPGGPGEAPRWTRGDKGAVGTAYSTASRVWYSMSCGILNEVYFPTIDRPQIRDLQYLITDGDSFLHKESDLQSEMTALAPHSLGVRVTCSDPEGRYRLIKEVIGHPHEACVLMHTKLEAEPEFRAKLRLFVLCNPHLNAQGHGNSGRVVKVAGQTVLTAYKNRSHLALAASIPFRRCSCGFVGENDGWQDLSDNYELDSAFECAHDGNIALTGELDLQQGQEWTLGLAFGQSSHNAIATLFQSLGTEYDAERERFNEQWQRACDALEELEKRSKDSANLYHRSQHLLLGHEDKMYPGALIASLSIPWGQAKGDQENLGYHLVWTRDLVQSTEGLLATENTSTPLRSLIYLAVAQRENGGFYQNFWVNGEPNSTGIQLDEVAYPILLAWRMHALDALQNFDPYPMVLQAARYLIEKGPVTPQERWEEVSGYSPATLATCIAALTCAAALAKEREEKNTADFIQAYADFLESHVEEWTVTSQGTLVPGISRHYIRITPADPQNPNPNENPDEGTVTIVNRPPDAQSTFPAHEIVDAGFLHLVRYGIRHPGDSLIKDSLEVVDRVLKVETPFGPSWHRYNHDGYGQRPDGGPFVDWGKGRAWPLLTGERGHYELAAGRAVDPYLRAMENFACAFGLLPEQVWDEDDIPEEEMFCGKPTGSAMPLMWAHAEYIKLLRSAADGRVWDFLPLVGERYLNGDTRTEREIWKPNRRFRQMRDGRTLRIQCPAPFRLRWTNNEWTDTQEARSQATALGIEYVDIQVPQAQKAPVHFTFYWLYPERWEGKNYSVEVSPKQ